MRLSALSVALSIYRLVLLGRTLWLSLVGPKALPLTELLLALTLIQVKRLVLFGFGKVRGVFVRYNRYNLNGLPSFPI